MSVLYVCFFYQVKSLLFLVTLTCAKFELFCAFRRGTPKLGMAKITQVDFPPRETVSYTKETQTPVVTQQKEGDSLILLCEKWTKDESNMWMQ